VALLLLLHERPGLRLHLVHLNHELRGAAADADAAFVSELADRLRLPCDVRRRSEIEPELANLPHNPSARYRAIRFEIFRRVVASEQLSGVMLAHHADDVAETVLQRLLRGSGYAGLRGMAASSDIDGLRIARPLLNVRREALRTLLRQRGQDWREDASNQSGDYLRNHLRRLLAHRPGLTESLLALSSACRELHDWTGRNAPRLESEFPAAQLARLPSILARRSARRWLIAAAAAALELSPPVLDRLIGMAADFARPSVQQFPGNLTVRRRAGRITSGISHVSR
jgi:tRNA(Ile)-lysidine synthase